MAGMLKSTRARRESARRFAAALAIVAAVTGGGCNLFNNSDSPSSPTPDTSTETFGGTIVQGANRPTFTVTVTQTGPVTVTLTTMSPSVAMGLGIGTASGTTGCTLTSSNTSVLAGSVPQLTVTEPAGTYCISLYDVGNLTGTATFTVTVSHS
jgi:hypothetical protein